MRLRKRVVGISIVAGVFLLLGDAPAAASKDAPTTGSQGTAAADASVPEKLRSIIAKTLKVNESKVTANASFAKDLGADDLALVELVMAYEEQFKIRISDAEADQFRQVRDVVAYLRKRGVVK